MFSVGWDRFCFVGGITVRVVSSAEEGWAATEAMTVAPAAVVELIVFDFRNSERDKFIGDDDTLLVCHVYRVWVEGLCVWKSILWRFIH